MSYNLLFILNLAILSLMPNFNAMSQDIIFDFNKSSKLKNWGTVNDDVMGGVSSSKLMINKDGHGIFHGAVSLENNGGFCSIRYNFNTINISPNSILSIKLKGDKKKYQVRVKPNTNDYKSYIYTFVTSGDWQYIKIKLKDMYPSFRGRKLNSSNFSYENLEQISLLIGNNKDEKFKILIDEIIIY